MNGVSISISEIFEFPSIRGLTEEYINNHRGGIPVYGGRMTESPVGFVADNLPEAKYFENCLAWNREGSVGYVFWHKHRFSTNDHHRPLLLKTKYLDLVNLEYARIVLQLLLLSSGFSWGKTASKEKVKNMHISFPTDDLGKISIIKQATFVKRYSTIFTIQNKLSSYQKVLNSSLVSVENHYPQVNFSLTDNDCVLSIGKRVLKKDLVVSGIPVFSANVHKPFGYIAKSNLNDFQTASLIWGIDGIFDWNLIPPNQVFATTDHCGRLLVNNPKILPEYIFYALRESASSYGLNRSLRASLSNIGNISVGIPINDNGSYNIDAQVEIINRQKKIELIRRNLLALISKITQPSVEIII
jgi:restriction endonuclease S subunit